jgi:hypothetical protein
MIVNGLWLGGWVTAIAVLEAACLRPWGGWVAACQVGLVTVLGIGLWRRPGEALVAGLWGGVITEGLSAAPFGSSLLAFGLVAWGTVCLRRHLYKEHPLVQMGLAAAAVAVGWGVGWYVATVGGHVAGTMGAWLRGAVAVAVPTALMAPWWLRLIRPIVMRVW